MTGRRPKLARTGDTRTADLFGCIKKSSSVSGEVRISYVHVDIV